MISVLEGLTVMFASHLWLELSPDRKTVRSPAFTLWSCELTSMCSGFFPVSSGLNTPNCVFE